MGSDNENKGGADLSPAEKAQYQLKKEIKSMKVQEAKWNKEPTIFDKVPDHERPFPIEPFPHERQRIPFKMTDEDRKRRQIYLESQQLTDREPVRVPELERMIYNPIRRLYRLPTDRLFNALAPVIGAHRVPFARYIVPKLFLGYLIGVAGWYNIKYNTQVTPHPPYPLPRSRTPQRGARANQH